MFTITWFSLFAFLFTAFVVGYIVGYGHSIYRVIKSFKDINL